MLTGHIQRTDSAQQCQRALATRGTVVIDVTTCDTTSGGIADQLATQISAQIPA
jgi:hypothetical protein